MCGTPVRKEDGFDRGEDKGDKEDIQIQRSRAQQRRDKLAYTNVTVRFEFHGHLEATLFNLLDNVAAFCIVKSTKTLFINEIVIIPN